MQIGWLVSETDFLNLYVDFCYFKRINRSKRSSLTLASVHFSKRAAREQAAGLAAGSLAGI